MNDHISIPGVKLINYSIFLDLRGDFKKTFNATLLKENQIQFDVRESYITTSKKNVLRGMHFQSPPYDQDKIVSCIEGEVIDVIVDLRKESPSYKKVNSFNLIDKNPAFLFLPKGIAHGFLSMSEKSQMQYFLNSEYQPDYDDGILWSSIDFDWQINNPIMSERDKLHQPLTHFESPF